jgi:cytochrome c oxidase subunit III
MMSPRTLAAPPRLQDPPAGADGFPGSGGSVPFPDRPAAAPASIAVWLLAAAVTILFAAFTSTYLARRGEADWVVGPLPALLYVSTGVLLLSSGVLEGTRRAGTRGRLDLVRSGLGAATALGIGFLAIQIAAWRQLAALGVFLASNPHSAFFYLLTGTHGLHVVGGLAWLGYALVRTRRAAAADAAVAGAGPAVTFWHFLAGLWLYLFFILYAL